MWGELSSEWGKLSSECGASCLGASFLWGELSWGELSLGRVVRNPSRSQSFPTDTKINVSFLKEGFPHSIFFCFLFSLMSLSRLFHS